MPVYTLGCASVYDVEVRYQGGGHLWTKVQGLTGLKWGRKLDDFSEASITVTKSRAGADCCGKLGDTHVWGHELRIVRDRKTVWAGPITRIRENRTKLTFEARDMLFWLWRRALYQGPGGGTNFHYWQPADTGAIIRDMITKAFPKSAPDWDPGLIDYAVLEDSGTLSTTDLLWQYTQPVGEVVKDLISAGVDLYTVGRHIYSVSDTKAGDAAPHRLREADFLTELEVVENGLDANTHVFVVGGQPVDGAGNPIQNVSPVVGGAGDVDPFYGLVTTFSESNNVVRQDVADGIAQARLAYGNPPPVDIIVPSGAQLSPQAPVDIGQLVPGAVFQVDLDSYCRRVSQPFRLNELTVTWNDDDVEKVAVSLASNGPATQGAAA